MEISDWTHIPPNHRSNDNCNSSDAQSVGKCLNIGIFEGQMVYLGYTKDGSVGDMIKKSHAEESAESLVLLKGNHKRELRKMDRINVLA